MRPGNLSAHILPTGVHRITPPGGLAAQCPGTLAMQMSSALSRVADEREGDRGKVEEAEECTLR